MGGAGEKKTDNPLIARRNIQYVGDLSEVPPAEKRDYTMEEIAKFDGSDKSKPLIFAINGEVYDITRWVSRHPGGKIVAQYAGEDATDVYTAMHPDKEVSNKYMKTYKIGNVVSQKIPQHLVEFRELRKQAESEGLFKPNYFFYLFHLGHILLAEFVAWWLMTTYSSSWLVWIFGCAILGGAQAQAGWLQHDFGHLSVFKKSSTNHWAHRFIISFLKAASGSWWNYRHYRHHAKPNIPIKDPDVTLPYVFVLGENPAKKWASKKKMTFLPYQFQHFYYYVMGPPLLLPTYFHYENLRFVFLKKDYIDLAFMVAFFCRYMAMFAGTFGFLGTLAIYMFMRSLESHWFVWVTQMSHIPMDIDFDKRKDWLTLQAEASCNVHPSLFNDWFTGHLNFQIEHHLFPTMPRHNLIKITQRVQSICKKHGIRYSSKPLGKAFSDIPSSLKEYGRIWYDAFYNP